jgi:hypothetical protein
MVKIHVNMHVIRRNKKLGETNPPLTIIRGRKREYASEIDIIGSARVVYSPDKPLSCGARVWIEADDAKVVNNGGVGIGGLDKRGD